jgi:mono/diheme cytochrome c family protein
MGSKILVGVLAVSALSALTGCRGQTSKDSPVVGIRNMYDQPRYDVQEESSFFADHRTMRPLVDGVVSHDQDVDPQISQGRLDDESGYVLEIPKTVIARNGGMQAMLERGKARYGIYCTPCHDGTGTGEGLAKRRAVASGAAAFVPPTFHQDRIRHMPDGQLFATITNGKSNMPPYAMQIKVDDRWSIVAYVRALQVAQPKLPAMAAPVPTTVPGGTSVPAPGGTTMPAPGGTTRLAPSTTASEAASGYHPQPTGVPPTKPTGGASAAVPVDSAHQQEKKP